MNSMFNSYCFIIDSITNEASRLNGVPSPVQPIKTYEVAHIRSLQTTLENVIKYTTDNNKVPLPLKWKLSDQLVKVITFDDF